VCRRLPAAAAIALVGSTAANTARADPARLPVPEPIFGESVTDIDGLERGELEVSSDAGELRARRGGAALQLAGVEAEWLATRRLGLRVEPSLVRADDGPGASHTDAGVGTSLAWKLVHDPVDDFYMQLEASAEWPRRAEGYSPPDEAGLPFALDLRGAWRSGPWTIRGALGGAAGGPSPHVPLRGSLALLRGFDRSARAGFFGIEALADGTWISPVFVAPDVVADLAPLGLPARVGLALPWSPSAGDTQPSFGVYLRLIVEPLRDMSAEGP
jgi:hypothetical protein